MIKSTFFDRVKKDADLRYNKIKHEMEQQAEFLMEHFGRSMTEQMKLLKEMYDRDISAPACHVVISYMRTGLLDRQPLYSLAMYDESFFFSEKEHLVMWDIPEISDALYTIIDEAKEAFLGQTKIPIYYLDELLFTYGDRFNEWFMEHIPHVIGCHLADQNWLGFYQKNAIRISAGEYRDRVKKIFEWR